MANYVLAGDERTGIDGSWDREARRLGAVAGELGIPLDPERILLYDVRELVTLRLRLQDALLGHGRRRWPGVALGKKAWYDFERLRSRHAA